jgi:hypothetical protein
MLRLITWGYLYTGIASKDLTQVMINALIIHGKGTGGSKYEVNFPDL